MNDKQCSRELIVDIIRMRDAGWDAIAMAEQALVHPSQLRRYVRLYDLYGAEFFDSHVEMREAKSAFLNSKKSK